MLEFAREHPRDDLHVAVRVRVEARAAPDDVVVVHEQQPVAGVAGVVVVAEAERVVGVQPADVGGESVGSPSHVDDGGGWKRWSCRG